MSPFSQILHELRVRYRLRQAELADVLGYEQSYISALELGIKGPPTAEFVDRLIEKLSISYADQSRLRAAAVASQRKLVINSDSPPDVYWLLNELRDGVNSLTPVQVRMIREILSLRNTLQEDWREPARRLGRRKKKEVEM